MKIYWRMKFQLLEQLTAVGQNWGFSELSSPFVLPVKGIVLAMICNTTRRNFIQILESNEPCM